MDFNFLIYKKLSNAYTQLVVNKDLVSDIKVKAKFNERLLGHAVFFGLMQSFFLFRIFLKSRYYKSLKREVIIDDYFKFLISNKLIKASYMAKLYNIGSLI